MRLKKELVGAWLTELRPESSIIISSRIRLARNLKNFPFEIKATENDQRRIIETVKEAIRRTKLSKELEFYGNSKLTPLYLNYLLERHLVSPHFVSTNSIKGVFVNRNETLSLMVNEEDHLRFQVLSPGLSLADNLKQINQFDDLLEKELEYAFSPKIGFLTACPTNIGTGMRASVLIHLPGLITTGEIDKVIKGVTQLGLAVRGLYGEGTATKGSYFQISNQFTTGVSEEEIIKRVSSVIEQVLNYENKARDFILKNLRLEIEDKVYRAYGILLSASLLTSEEAIGLLSSLRFGISMGLIKDIPLLTINILNILVKPANLQIFLGKELAEEERDEQRAILVKSVLKEKKIKLV